MVAKVTPIELEANELDCLNAMVQKGSARIGVSVIE